MKKFTPLFSILLLFAFSWQGMAQSLINITTSGGGFPNEKWVNITTEIDGAGTQIWGQGDGTYGNGVGLINEDILIAPGTYYVNCYDNYADGWDETLILVTAYGSVLADNAGESPDDGTNDDASNAWGDTQEQELEASLQIVVNEAPTDTLDWYNIQWISNDDNATGSDSSLEVDVNTSITAYAQAYESGITNVAGYGAGIECWFAGSSTDSDPSTWPEESWQVATYNTDVDDNDEYKYSTIADQPGVVYIATRWRLNYGPFTYGGYDGPWDGSTNNSIALLVNAPAGSMCDDPILISTLPYSTSDDTANYGDYYENGDSPCDIFYMSGDEVFYTYTPASDVNVDITLSNIGGTYSGIHIWDACLDASPNCVAFEGNSGNSDRVIENLELVGGITYYFAISTWASPQSVTYDLSIVQNTCTNATLTYTVVNDCVNGDQFLIDVEVTDMGSATSLTVSDDQASATQGVTAVGTTQFGPYANATDVVISVVDDADASCEISSGSITQIACPPANDDCSSATPYTDAFTLFTVGNCVGTSNFIDLSAAVEDITDYPSCDTQTNYGVWYTWNATSLGLVFTSGTGNPGLTVYEVGTCGTLVEVACLNNVSGQITGLNIGDDYIFYIWNDIAGNSVDFCLEEFTPPANDVCADATPVYTLPYAMSQDATFATNNDAFVYCDDIGMNDGVWYTFTVESEGDITIDLTSTGWDAGLAIYSGSCEDLTCVDNVDDVLAEETEILTFTGVVGTQYWVNIGYWSDSIDGSEGPFELNISSPDDVLSILNQSIDGFVMFPNPVANTLNLNAKEQIDVVSVYNMLGQEVLRNFPSATQVQLDTSSLPTGAYIVKLQAGEQLGSYNLIKQ